MIKDSYYFFTFSQLYASNVENSRLLVRDLEVYMSLLRIQDLLDLIFWFIVFPFHDLCSFLVFCAILWITYPFLHLT